MHTVKRLKSRERAPRAKPAESLGEGLTRDEDDELRRLHYFSQFGALAGQKLERFLELRLRDRRKAVRKPREFDVSEQPKADMGAERQSVLRQHPNIWLR
jgi:hypothetical protein